MDGMGWGVCDVELLSLSGSISISSSWKYMNILEVPYI